MAPFGYIPPPSTGGGGGGGGAGEVEIAVTVSNSKFVLDGVSQQDFTFLPGMIYKFDVSDSTNAGHVFSLSLTDDNSGSSEYTTGRTRDGTPGNGGSENVQWDVPLDVADTVYYYCSNHPAMGGVLTKTGIGDGGAAGIAAMEFDSTGLEDSIATLGFKIAAQNSLAKFDLPNQIVDDFKTQADSEVDISASTNITTDSYGAHSSAAGRWSGYIPATSADTHFSNVKVLCNFDGATLVDQSPNSSSTTFDTTTYDGASLNTSVKMFDSTGSWFVSGTAPTADSGIVISGWGNTDNDDDFTLEFFYYPTNSAGRVPLVSIMDTEWSLDATIDSSGSNRIFSGSYSYWYYDGGNGAGGAGFPSAGGDVAFALNAWNYICIERSGATLRISSGPISGSLESETFTLPSATTDMGNSTKIRLGTDGGTGNVFEGYFDSLRWTMGVARNSGNAPSIPTESFPTSGSAGAETFNNIELVSNAQTASVAPTTADIVVLYDDTLGTAILNTDIKVWASRDNGTTWTQGTLGASDASIGGEKIASAHDIFIAGQPSGTQVRYKITTHNQSNAKLTSIGGVSLGWKDPATSTVTAGGSGGVTDLTVATDGLEDDIAALAFKIAADNNLDDFKLSNQIVDDFKTQADSEVNISDSTNITTGSYGAHSSAAGRWNGYVAAEVGDSDWSDVIVLIQSNESSTSQDFEDLSSTGHSITYGGDPEHTTSQYKFGTSSIYLDGTGDILYIPGTNLAMGTTWTIEGWFRFDAAGFTANNDHIMNQNNQLYNNGIGNFVMNTNGAHGCFGGQYDTGTFGFTADTWHHVAWTSNSSTFNIWVDGVDRTNGPHTAGAINLTSTLQLGIGGRGTNGSNNLPFYLAELRITKDVARYTADFSSNLPTEMFGTSGTTVPEAFNNIELVSNAQGASAVPSTADVTILYDDTIGTATLNTDIKAWASRDNGTTWTEGVLVAGDTIGSEKLASAHDIDVSGQPSGSQIRYKITTHNQSSALLTSVGGVSLGWTNPSDVTYATVTAERGVSVVANKSALQAITPSGATGQFYFVTDNKGMYYSNGSVWTLLGSDAPGWGSFTENYGTLDMDNGSGGTITHTPTSTGSAGSGTPQATSTLSVTDESQAIHEFASDGVTVTCVHSGAHTGSHSLASAGVTIGATSGDITITPPQAWEGDSVVMPVTATDGINIINKNIQWSVKADWPAQDTHWSNVKFLMDFNGDKVDESGTITTFLESDQPLETTIKKWGSGSLNCTNSETSTNLKYDQSFQYTAASLWTWEAWVYLETLTAKPTSQRSPSIITLGDIFCNLGIDNGVPHFFYTTQANAYPTVTHHQTMSTGQWYHVALSSDGTDTRIFLDGVVGTSTTTSEGFSNSTWGSSNEIQIGQVDGWSGQNMLGGYLDDVRITEGVCRYTATFDPPGGAFQTS